MPVFRGSITFKVVLRKATDQNYNHKVVEQTGHPIGCPFVFSRSVPWAETSTAIEVIEPISNRKTTHNFIVFMCIEVKTTDFAGTSL